MLYAWFDMGNDIQPIDRIFVMSRSHVGLCKQYFQRDNALNLVVANDTTSLVGLGPTPPELMCGALPDPITVPGNWYGASCGPRLGRYVWLRQAKYR